MKNILRASQLEIISVFSTDIEQGLSSGEVIARRRIHGLNKLDAAEKVKKKFA